MISPPALRGRIARAGPRLVLIRIAREAIGFQAVAALVAALFLVVELEFQLELELPAQGVHEVRIIPRPVVSDMIDQSPP